MAEPRCPQCHKLLDAAGELSGPPGAPSPGDVTICGYCGEILQLHETMLLLRVSPEKLKTFDALLVKQMLLAQRVILDYIKRKSLDQ